MMPAARNRQAPRVRMNDPIHRRNIRANARHLQIETIHYAFGRAKLLTCTRA
jgi:hypothetical protein